MQNAQPFTTLIRHLRLMGYALTALCLAWIAVVSLSLLIGLPQGELHNHRSPEIRERIAQCSGEFAVRYECSETILLSGEKVDVVSLALRVAVTAILPAIAWGVWTAAMRRTLEMCAAVAARLALEQRRSDRPPQSIQPA